MCHRWTSLILTALLGLTLARSVGMANPSGLTEVEQACQLLGSMAFDHTHARDRGVPYLTLAEHLRRILPEGTQLERSLKALILSQLRRIYDDPRRESPAVNRQAVELHCLHMLEDVERK